MKGRSKMYFWDLTLEYCMLSKVCQKVFKYKLSITTLTFTLQCELNDGNDVKCTTWRQKQKGIVLTGYHRDLFLTITLWSIRATVSLCSSKFRGGGKIIIGQVVQRIFNNWWNRPMNGRQLTVNLQVAALILHRDVPWDAKQLFQMLICNPAGPIWRVRNVQVL